MIVSKTSQDGYASLRSSTFFNHYFIPSAHGVLYFKYFSFLLQELSLEMDEEFIYAILDFSHLNVNGWNTNMDDRYSTRVRIKKKYL